MLGLLIATATAAAAGGYAAPECEVAFERRQEERLVLSLRPACPLSYASTQAAVRAILLRETASPGATLLLGRLERYPWLSATLARQASSSRRWNLAEGRPREGHENAYVAAALRGMPEFTALFGDWRIDGVAVEKVLLKPAAQLPLPAGAPVPPEARLPWDAIVAVILRRP